MANYIILSTSGFFQIFILPSIIESVDFIKVRMSEILIDAIHYKLWNILP